MIYRGLDHQNDGDVVDKGQLIDDYRETCYSIYLDFYNTLQELFTNQYNGMGIEPYRPQKMEIQLRCILIL